MTSATRVLAKEPFWKNISFSQTVVVDRSLLFGALSLSLLGWLMVTSASMDWAQRQFGNPFYISYRHAAYLILSISCAWLMVHIPLKLWHNLSGLLILCALVSLVVVLIPGIGREVNGSSRWLSLGFINIQPSEFSKLATVIYMAGYLDRRREAVRTSWSGFLRPLLVLSFVAVLLLLEPDFGAVVVMMLTALALLFLGGVKAGQFVLAAATVLGACIAILVSQPYRLERLIAYMDPWNAQNVYGSGYQLTQSLIAFGRGEWNGVGLGNSVQKLFYLPEAHTDFVFAIWSEETGMLGALVVIALFAFIFTKALMLGKKAFDEQRFFAAFCAYGVGMLFGLQAFINIGVNMGLLPTKGLTLPFVSYGGSSLLTCAISMGLLLRVHHELALNKEADHEA